MAKLLTTVLDKSLQWALMHSAEAECFAGVAWPLTVTFYLNEILSVCLRFCLGAVSASYLSDLFLSFRLLLTSGRLRLFLIMVYYKVLSWRLYCCCTSCVFSTFWQRSKTLFISFKPQDVSERQILHTVVAWTLLKVGRLTVLLKLKRRKRLFVCDPERFLPKIIETLGRLPHLLSVNFWCLLFPKSLNYYQVESYCVTLWNGSSYSCLDFNQVWIIRICCWIINTASVRLGMKGDSAFAIVAPRQNSSIVLFT